MKTKRLAMGRGLSALLDSPETDITNLREPSGKFSVGAVANIPLEQISANPFQPRTIFEEEALNELAESIKKQGIIQPVTVRKLGFENKYQLISGGRRYKASLIAGLTEIPAYIRTADDHQMLEMALVENIQRENLDEIEIAISYQRLIEECNLTHESLSHNVGKPRTTISNYLRLLKLPAEIQIGLRHHKISFGHARSLINVVDNKIQLKIFNDIVNLGLSVRKVEEIVRKINDTEKIQNPKVVIPQQSKYDIIRDKVSHHLNSKVDLKRNKNGKGTLIVKFISEDDLNRILEILNVKF